MGRRIKKSLLLIFVIAMTACSVDMLDYIGNKILLDELSDIPYRDMVSVTGVSDNSYSQEDTLGNNFIHNISSFYIAKYEVTYELWYTVHTWAISNGYTFANPGREGNDGTLTDPKSAAPTSAKYEPVTTINWRDAIVWCNAYSEMSGYSLVYYTNASYTAPLKTSTNNAFVSSPPAGSEDNPYVNWSANGYRLPTEGEWQYAASNRGATLYNCASGAAADYSEAGATGLVAWYLSNSSGVSHNVGTRIANQLVIYDMSGNMWEWCWDWTGAYPGPETDYTGPPSGAGRVGRGGTWGSDAPELQLGARGYLFTDHESEYIGFRLARGQ